MALPSASISFPSTSVSTSHSHLKESKRILALLGAGLSASSGLSTLRGVGTDGVWRGQDPAKILTPDRFGKDPELVWRYHQERRQRALAAEPNNGHFAIAKLAQIMGEEQCMVLSMNIDGLCVGAEHPRQQLLELHGSLFDIKCSNKDCDYFEANNFDPNFISISETNATIPKCPKCDHLLRPSVVWFGETIPKSITAAADKYIAESTQIDLIFVIGTTAQVWPAAGYVDAAIEKGARVAMVNIDRGDLVPGGGELGLTSRDCFFTGDAAHVVPELLKPIVETV